MCGLPRTLAAQTSLLSALCTPDEPVEWQWHAPACSTASCVSRNAVQVRDRSRHPRHILRPPRTTMAGWDSAAGSKSSRPWKLTACIYIGAAMCIRLVCPSQPSAICYCAVSLFFCFRADMSWNGAAHWVRYIGIRKYGNATRHSARMTRMLMLTRLLAHNVPQVKLRSRRDRVSRGEPPRCCILALILCTGSFFDMDRTPHGVDAHDGAADTGR